jgi:putative heme-binding domain-containing protein
MIEALAHQVGRQGDRAAVSTLESALAGLPAGGDSPADALVAGYLSGLAKASSATRAAPLPPTIAAARRALLDTTRAIAVDERAADRERVAAVRRLSLGTFTECRDTYAELLESRQPQALQLAAVETLRGLTDADVGAWLLERWAGMSPRLQAAVGGILVTREPWAVALLEAIAAGRVPLAGMDQAQVRLLEARPEPAIRDRYERLAARLATSPRQEVLAAYEPALTLPGDAGKGRAHFAAICGQCHRVDGVGYEVGPNLAAFKTRGPEAILLNMLDPNREVNPLYVNYVAVLDDGRTLTGMIVEETATSITLKRGDNASDTIPRAEIESLTSTGKSIMPEGIEKQLDQQAVADLLAYLMAVN